MNTSADFIADIQPYLLEVAKHGYPYEVGGFLIRLNNGQVIIKPCKNTVENPEQNGLDYFIMDAQAIVEAMNMGDVLATYHTHPMTPPSPSYADLLACVHSDLPMVIVNPLTEVFSYTTPESAQGLLDSYKEKPVDILGRDFVWGIHDCYGLVSDVYRRDLGIELPYYDRGVMFAWDENPEWDRFNQNFKDAGFLEYPVPRDHNLIEPYDIALMNLGGKYPTINHCAVIMPTDRAVHKDNWVFWHHVCNKKSQAGIFRGYWVDCTYKMLRHSSRL